jgi:hypothetical protein
MTNNDKPKRNPSWSREELILALNLYFELDSSQFTSSNPKVIELSKTLNKLNIHPERPDEERFRNPNSVSMKLSNFLRFDLKRNSSGLKRGGKLEEEIWNTFSGDQKLLREKVREIISKLSICVPEFTQFQEYNQKLPDNRHKNYEALNLIGYGLAKFDMNFVREFGFKTKTEFYEEMVRRGVGETMGTIKNRQDLFDPFFPNNRKGWWQKGDTYIHRKHLIDSLLGDYDVKKYASILKLYLKTNLNIEYLKPAKVTPIIKSKFNQLQLTGRVAELYFKENYQQIEIFKNGLLEDARLFGDGYDFQIQVKTKYFLVDVKGIRSNYGAFRMTEKEFTCAAEYKNDYGLVIVSNLENKPKMTTVFNPVKCLSLERKSTFHEQITYYSKAIKW